MMRAMRLLLTPCLALALLTPCFAEGDKTNADKTKEAAKEQSNAKPVVTQGKVTITGKSIDYTATTGKIALKDEEGKTKASIFYISYTRDKDKKQDPSRPVLFAFNGGPGASAVWLHIGMLGPKTLRLPEDGTAAPEPPVRVQDNPESLLDTCDLVFIDPVTTGYSDAADRDKAKDFHSLNGDIESVSDFIRLWVTQNNRWGSRKFLLGESYGGVRAAGVAEHLQSEFGMSLNGVVLLSSLLDFGTIQSAPGDDLSYACYLPSFASIAHYHGKVQGDAQALIAKAREFAFGDYYTALLQGAGLSEETRTRTAATLQELTSIPAATWIEHDLRLDSSFFRNELLRAEGKTIGRFDARVAWARTDQSSDYPDYDPSLSLAFGAFSTAILDYLGNDLKTTEDQPYEILTSKVQPWNWNSSNRVVNVSNRLSSAMRDNPRLRVLVMCADNDLATPAEGIAYSIRQLPSLPKSLRENISFTHYRAGHMFYLNPTDLSKSRADLLKFLNDGE